MMFIVLNFNNGVELKRAEQSGDAETQGPPVRRIGSYSGRDDSTLPRGLSGGLNAYDSLITRSPSPQSVEHTFDRQYSSSEDDANGDDDDAKYIEQEDAERIEATGNPLARERTL